MAIATKKITLTINGSRFDIDVETRFAEYLETQLAEDLNMEGNNSFKVLLQAYVRKNYELYELEAQMQKLLEQIEGQ
jgi:hypothetical protein